MLAFFFWNPVLLLSFITSRREEFNLVSGATYLFLFCVAFAWRSKIKHWKRSKMIETKMVNETVNKLDLFGEAGPNFETWMEKKLMAFIRTCCKARKYLHFCGIP